MNDKEKQIEKLANIIADCRFTDPKSEAIDLYNAKCRILPEDSVVLTREEYHKLKMLERHYITCEDVNEYITNARKETADKIIKDLWDNKFETTVTIQNNCSKEDVENIGKAIIISIRNKLVDLARQYNVEITND